ncbi:MarR family transcriptional regulator [Streptomyces spiroverticillatus]|uniref:MarR family transcriptional regulator n=1 Tax=Streptomyces finlayi TaxID=67296 RepID=A0A918WWG2_9ACTN|nr:MarR family winged helix-turn-helix transcriptional regulator [Streptomyces finlayi]GHA07157.1 MarR family transcriptional regulator [Streptomyces spiroverticillatus]GHC90584.1 MarR family transcriptional regulator [Streptomyces finlayi]
MTKNAPESADDLLNAAGPALGKLRRSSLLDVANPISAKDLSRTLVLNIVLEAEQAGLAEQAGRSKQAGQTDPPAEPREITVGGIAAHLGADPSVASRMVSDCIGAGYLVRAASQRDGRRTVLHLSEAGRELMARFRRHQRSAFEAITADWAETERLEFVRLLLKYVASQDALRPSR